MLKPLPVLLLSLLLIGPIGCNTGSAPTLSPEEIAGAQARLVLAEEPEGPVTPLDLREQEGFTGGDVVLVGQVGGVANPYESLAEFPWKPGEATFFLVDPSTAAKYAEHAGDDPDHAKNCAFCASHADQNIESIAEVTFTDEAGKPLAIGAKQLLALNEGDVVVVRGEAKILPSPGGATDDQLVVVASGVYIRK